MPNLPYKYLFAKAEGWKTPGWDVDGWMGPTDLAWLHEVSKRMSSIIEIGSWCGKSTSALAAGCKGPVTAVDHFKGSPEMTGQPVEANPRGQFAKVMAKYPNITLIEEDSLSAAAHNPSLYADMVFIDALHDYDSVLADIRAWAPRARKIVSGHDLGYSYPGVFKAVVKYYGTQWDNTPGVIWWHEVK